MYLLAGQVVTAGVAFLVNLLAASVMVPAARGQLAFYLQVTYLLTVVSLLGVERPFLASRRGSFAAMLAEFVSLIRPGWWVTALPLGAGCILLLIGNRAGGIACMLIALYLVCNTMVRAIRCAYIASGARSYFVLSSIVTQALLLVGCLVLALLHEGSSLFWLCGYAATSLLAVGIVLRNADRELRLSEQRGLREQIRRRGLRLLPASLGNTAMLRSDRLLLPLLSTNAELGIYVVVATVMEMTTWPVQQWVDSSLGAWSRGRNRSRRGNLAITLRSGAMIVLLAAVLAPLSLLVVKYMLPPEYFRAQYLILPLGVSSVFYGMSRVQQGLLIARGYSSQVSIVEVSGMALAVGAYLVLIPEMGGMGAAVGSVVGYTACFIIGAIVLFRDSLSMEVQE